MPSILKWMSGRHWGSSCFWGTVKIELLCVGLSRFFFCCFFSCFFLGVFLFFRVNFESLGPKFLIAPEWEGVCCMANCLVVIHPQIPNDILGYVAKPMGCLWSDARLEGVIVKKKCPLQVGLCSPVLAFEVLELLCSWKMKEQNWGYPPYWLLCWKPLLCLLTAWSSHLRCLPNPPYKPVSRRN